MQKNNVQQIRDDFGKAIYTFRKSHCPQWSQEAVCIKVNNIVNADMSALKLYQKKLSRIEHGDASIMLPVATIQALKSVCQLADDIVNPYLQLMQDSSQKQEYCDVFVPERGQLLTNPSHSEFQGYMGAYYCYFYSTDSEDKKIIQGRLTIEVNSDGTACTAKMEICDAGQVIKKYTGQFMMNKHYRAWYCVLIGENKQEISLLTSSHLTFTREKNLLNIALVLTTSAGKHKRPTMHRMLISRTELKQKVISQIHSQLKLNAHGISISETELDALEVATSKKLKKAKAVRLRKQYQAVIESIEYIRENGEKKIYYQIEESSISKNCSVKNDPFLRGCVLSALRDHTEERYYNKVGQNVHDICMDIITKKKK